MSPAAPGRCSDEFFKCVDGVIQRRWCPQTLVFTSADGGACVGRPLAPECRRRDQTTTTTTPRTTTTTVDVTNVCAGVPDGVTHQLGDCTDEYCVCEGGRAVFRRCVEGLVFQQDTGCVWRYSVPGRFG